MLNKKIAFLTGITGQDGSYLAELLIEKKIRSSRYDKKVINYKYKRMRPYL
jgi:GDPmannose 4,6-dehydratase